ncbi:MAG: hypothetical protein SFV51_20295 [Bryobacteraceae bacterium]|nr:hypothetical protein [Bryobacteraceae bacterium]
MSRLGLGSLLAIPFTASGLWAQATFGSHTGRLVGSISDPGFASRLGATVSGLPQTSAATLPHGARFSPPSFYPQGRGGYGHSGRQNRTVVVPFGVPVYYGGYPYGGDVPAGQTIVQQVQPSPSVIINQYYTPETVRPRMQEYSELPEPAKPDADEGPVRVYPPPKPATSTAPQAPKPAARTEDERPTITLLAFSDSSVVAAIGYWTQGDTLHYVTSTFGKKTAPLGTLDRSLTDQLNRERSVEFKLESVR